MLSAVMTQRRNRISENAHQVVSKVEKLRVRDGMVKHMAHTIGYLI